MWTIISHIITSLSGSRMHFHRKIMAILEVGILTTSYTPSCKCVHNELSHWMEGLWLLLVYVQELVLSWRFLVYVKGVFVNLKMCIPTRCPSRNLYMKFSLSNANSCRDSSCHTLVVTSLTLAVTSLRDILLSGEIFPSRTVTASIEEGSLGGTFSLGSRDLSRAISQRAWYKSAVCCMAASWMARFSRCSN